MAFTTLLHTYLCVDDILKTTVKGLQTRQYVDQVDGKAIKDERNESVVFREEVDRIYINGGAAPVRVNDGGNCELLLKTTGFSDYVVWNPHIAKTKGMADMPEDGYKKFVCVEAGQVAEPVVLKAGDTWEGAQGISIQLLTDSEVARTLAEQQFGAGKL